MGHLDFPQNGHQEFIKNVSNILGFSIAFIKVHKEMVFFQVSPEKKMHHFWAKDLSRCRNLRSWRSWRLCDSLWGSWRTGIVLQCGAKNHRDWTQNNWDLMDISPNWRSCKGEPKAFGILNATEIGDREGTRQIDKTRIPSYVIPATSISSIHATYIYIVPCPPKYVFPFFSHLLLLNPSDKISIHTICT